jgi:phosphatidylserine/phosphatidylglycerophosphate/cardiolipin synthase-like enzyme
VAGTDVGHRHVNRPTLGCPAVVRPLGNQNRETPLMLRRLGAVVALVMLTTGAAAGSAAAWQPEPGAHFNNPWGKRSSKERLVKIFVRAVNHALPGSTIRVATYSNDRKDIADALIGAHRRGVHVQVLLNDNWTSYQTKRIQRRLGSDTSKDSFLRICKRSCRGKRGNLHSKFYLFSRTGTSTHTTMMGSANLTGNGVKIQWNDLYTVNGNKPMYDVYSSVFNQMKHDRPLAHPFRAPTVRGAYNMNFYPRYNTTKSDDPIMKRLNKVRCHGAAGPTGIGNRTLIRISMYGWNGVRGRYLADKVASLSRHGCDVRVIHSDGGGYVVRHLRANGVRIRTASYDRNRNGTVDMYTHEKYMILSGKLGDRAGWHVWTGSQNWSDVALNGDEVTMHIPRRGAFYAYRKNFDYIWTHHTHRTG